jgi:hypothetical protein
MSFIRCIARAYHGEPLERLATGHGASVTYILNPSHVNAGGICTGDGVGFPKLDVFEYESHLMDQLLKTYARGDRVEMDRLWNTAKRLNCEKIPNVE